MALVVFSRVNLCGPSWAWPCPGSSLGNRPSCGSMQHPAWVSMLFLTGYVTLGASLPVSGPRWLPLSLLGAGEKPELQLSDRCCRQEGSYGETHAPFLSFPPEWEHVVPRGLECVHFRTSSSERTEVLFCLWALGPLTRVSHASM